MKKFNLLISLAMLGGSLVLSSPPAKAQDDEKKAEFERTWYDSCVTKKDDKCLTLSKELMEKYPQSQYAKFADQKLKADNATKLWDKFQTTLKANYTAPQDANKLEALFTAGEDYLKIQPDQPYVVAQLGLAGANGVLGQFYKNLDKAKSYAEKALKLFESATPPKDTKPEEWNPLRELVQATMNQYLGYYLIETKGDPMQAIDYLTKATQVKNKEGAGWKDPNNYWLRARIYSSQYEDLRKKYDALPDDQKTGDSGKELLKQVNQLLDTKLIADYARTIAAANKPETKGLRDAATELFNSFWKFRTGAPEKATAYLKSFEADPTVAGPEIPAKSDTADNNGPAPVTTGSNAKLATGTNALAPGNGSTKSATNGTKATSSKSGKGAKRGRRG